MDSMSLRPPPHKNFQLHSIGWLWISSVKPLLFRVSLRPPPPQSFQGHSMGWIWIFFVTSHGQHQFTPPPPLPLRTLNFWKYLKPKDEAPYKNVAFPKGRQLLVFM